MATFGWGTDTSVKDWLFQEPYRFEFYQAVRLLELLRPDQVSVGCGVDPAREPVRFHSNIGFAFPASDIVSVLPSPFADTPPDMAINFLGLAGPFGPLPIPYSEFIVERQAKKDSVSREFLDLFNHRLVSLFYQARKVFHVGFESKPPQETALARYLSALAGMGTSKLEGRLAISDRVFLPHSAQLGHQIRSLSGLEGLLKNYFHVPVHVQSFCGQWQTIEDDQQTVIGSRGKNQAIGMNLVLGRRVWDMHQTCRVMLGPLTSSQLQNLLPVGWGYRPLHELTTFYCGPTTDVQYQLELKSSDIPGSYLSQRPQGARLGWTSWLRMPQLSEESSSSWVSPRPYEMPSSLEHDGVSVRLTARSGLLTFTKLRHSLFGDLPINELTELVGGMVRHTYPARTVIVKQGESGESMFLIDRGQVEVLVRGCDETERSVGRLSAGAFFGEMSLLNGKPRMATVITMEDCIMYELSKAQLEDVVTKFPRIQKTLEAYAGRRAIVAR